MSDIDKEEVIEKRWEDFYEWLDTCPIKWIEGRHPTSDMLTINFYFIDYKSEEEILEQEDKEFQEMLRSDER